MLVLEFTRKYKIFSNHRLLLSLTEKKAHFSHVFFLHVGNMVLEQFHGVICETDVYSHVCFLCVIHMLNMFFLNMAHLVSEHPDDVICIFPCETNATCGNTSPTRDHI